jgi:hypothetical protein
VSCAREVTAGRTGHLTFAKPGGTSLFTQDRHFRDGPTRYGMVFQMPTPRELHPDPAAAKPLARARLSPGLEQELHRAVEEIERGEYIELTTEDLDRWVDDGVSAWSDESRG